ncbi:MAG TPA: GDSL-type esterase/lipase family protein, partial [Planctomycetota bacterium]|nr:GDSL-type esterase/lipase family protein [Planctomycetota bacterium]
DLVSFQHPALRRLNGWLREHRFRGRSFEREKPAGALRVLAVGSSSTFGHGVPEETGLDYPTQLEALLAERWPGVTVQVVNGAVPGSSSAASLRFLREVLLGFEPDVVIVCFAFNDAYHATQADEDRYLERITRPGYERAAVEDAEAAELLAGKLRLKRLLALFEARPGPTLPLWEQVLAEQGAGGPQGDGRADPGERTPPERFASTLRAYARLCAERGATRVLVKEPFRGDPPRIWKDEFYAVIDAVGAESGAAVLDPRPALAAQGGAALFLDEVHPAPAGHAVIARELLPLVARLLEPRAEALRRSTPPR